MECGLPWGIWEVEEREVPGAMVAMLDAICLMMLAERRRLRESIYCAWC